MAHEGGKLAVTSTKELRDRRDLSLLYTPGVADVCLAIAADPSLASVYTMRRNTVAARSATARPCWASATSARRPPCP